MFDRYCSQDKMPKALTYEQVRDYIASFGEELVNTSYSSDKVDLDIKCGKCGFVYQVTYNNFKHQESRCSKCAKESRAEKRRHALEDVRQIVTSRGDVLMSTTYANNRTALSIKCGRCKSLFVKTLSDYNRSNNARRCDICSRARMRAAYKLHTDRAIEICDKARLRLLTGYKNMHDTEVVFQCIDCDHKFCTSLDSIKFKNTGCPKCKASAAENGVMNYLEQLTSVGKIVSWSKEYKFVDCRDKRPLPFDFAVFISGRSGPCLIECDGIQHFKPTMFHAAGDADEYLKRTIEHDEIKDFYCAMREIPLLRIAYTDTRWITDLIDSSLARLDDSDFSIMYSNYSLYCSRH
jgi:hypothetical protein